MPDSWSNIFVGLACITAFRVKRPLDGIYLWSPKAANGIISLFSITQEYSAVCVCMCMYVLSRFSCVWLFATPWTIACQAPLSVSFSRQEYWSGWPCPPPGGLPNPEIEPLCILHWQAGYLFTITATWEDRCVCVCVCIFVCVCMCIYLWGFPGAASGKEPSCHCRRYKRPGFNPWVRKIPWRRPLQYSYLENLMGRGAWWAMLNRSERVRHNWSNLAHTRIYR